jgi:hypothetical protein
MKLSFVCRRGVVAATPAFAPGLPPASRSASPPQPSQRGYAGVKPNLTEKSPDARGPTFSFKPGPARVAQFGMLFGHVPTPVSGPVSAALGQPNPNQGHNLETERRPRKALSKGLADSFALATSLCRAARSKRDGNGTAGQTRLRARAAGGSRHSQQRDVRTASVYLRAKGLVPPSPNARVR